MARGRRRAPRPAARDAVRARRNRRPPLRGSRRRPALGEPRRRRHVDAVRAERRPAPIARRARLRGRVTSAVADARHLERRRVAWVDTDAGGRIHFTAAFRWAEAAETELVRSLGVLDAWADFPRRA